MPNREFNKININFSSPSLLALLAFALIEIAFITNSFASEKPSGNVLTTKKHFNDFNAQYALDSNKYKLKIKANRTLTSNKNGSKTLQLNASAFIAKIKQQSSFEFNECEITPNSYLGSQSIFGKKKTYSLNFDQENKKFTETHKKQSKKHPLDNKIYDELSYQLALRCDLIAGKDTFEYQVRRKGITKSYIFYVEGEETIKTKSGEHKTVKMSRKRSNTDPSSIHETFIWFAKDLDFMMVKLEQVDDDETLKLELKKITYQ